MARKGMHRKFDARGTKVKGGKRVGMRRGKRG